MEDVIKAGVKTKILLLSATPVNNRMNDIKNQIYFITEGRNDAFADLGLPNLEILLKKAQASSTNGPNCRMTNGQRILLSR